MTGLKTGQDHKRLVYIGPVQSFRVLEYSLTGYGYSPSKNRQKTGPDRTFKLYRLPPILAVPTK